MESDLVLSSPTPTPSSIEEDAAQHPLPRSPRVHSHNPTLSNSHPIMEHDTVPSSMAPNPNSLEDDAAQHPLPRSPSAQSPKSMPSNSQLVMEPDIVRSSLTPNLSSLEEGTANHPVPRSPSVYSHESTLSSLSVDQRRRHDSTLLSGSVFLITSDGKTLSLPVPSASPHDPLNWSPLKRALAILQIIIFSVTSLIATQGVSLLVKGIKTYFRDQGCGEFNLEILIVAPTLSMGLGCLVWVPLTFAVGRRPPFLAASCMLLVSTAIAGIATNFYLLLVCVCLLGFSEGFALSVAFLILIDVTFIHERTNMIAAVWSIVGFISGVAQAWIPFLTDHGKQWHHMYFYCTIPAAVACAGGFVFFPETYFKRPIVAYDGLTLLQTASEKLLIYDDEEATPDFPAHNKDLPAAPSRNWFQAFRDQFYIRSSRASWKSMLHCYPQVFQCLLNPLIFWVLVMTASNFAGMMLIGSTYATVLSVPPYSLPSSLLIHVNTASGIGSLLAWPLCGILLNRILKEMSRRNKGIREAEHYLFGYILPVITGSLSTAIYGCAVRYKWHYTLYYLAYGLNSFSFVGISITNTLWVTEAFPRWAAAALVVVGGGSYITSFGMSFALVPWLQAQGFRLVGIELTVIQLVTGLVFTPIAFWGKGLRQKIHGRWAESREGALRPL